MNCIFTCSSEFVLPPDLLKAAILLTIVPVEVHTSLGNPKEGCELPGPRGVRKIRMQCSRSGKMRNEQHNLMRAPGNWREILKSQLGIEHGSVHILFLLQKVSTLCGQFFQSQLDIFIFSEIAHCVIKNFCLTVFTDSPLECFSFAVNRSSSAPSSKPTCSLATPLR